MYSLAAMIHARLASFRPELLVGMRLSSHTTTCEGARGEGRTSVLSYRQVTLLLHGGQPRQMALAAIPERFHSVPFRPTHMHPVPAPTWARVVGSESLTNHAFSQSAPEVMPTCGRGAGVGMVKEQVHKFNSAATLPLLPVLSTRGALDRTCMGVSQPSLPAPHLGQRAVDLHGHGAALGAQVLHLLRLLHRAEGAVEARVAAGRNGWQGRRADGWLRGSFVAQCVQSTRPHAQQTAASHSSTSSQH